jgi:hypothetical protein
MQLFYNESEVAKFQFVLRKTNGGQLFRVFHPREIFVK